MQRECLPHRRASVLFDFESMDISFTASVRRYEDGRIAELFIDNHKAGSAIGTPGSVDGFDQDEAADECEE